MIPTIDQLHQPVTRHLMCLSAICLTAAAMGMTGCRSAGSSVTAERSLVSAKPVFSRNSQSDRIHFSRSSDLERRPGIEKQISDKSDGKDDREAPAGRLQNVSFQDDNSVVDTISNAGGLQSSSTQPSQAEPVPWESPSASEAQRLSVTDTRDGVIVSPDPGNILAAEQLTLEAYESMVLSNQPAIAEAAARVEALRGKHLQAGLGPNPTFGLNGEDIGEDGEGGRYGVYFGRRIVRGGKLQRSQSVVCAELEVAEKRLQAARQRVLTDARMRFYDLLVAQKKLEIAQQLSRLSVQAVETSQMLFDAAEIARTTVLQSELEAQQTVVIERQAENQLLGARRRLATLVGESDLIEGVASGGINDVLLAIDFESSFEQLTESSPELAELFASVEQARRQLERERVQAIPDVTWQATLQYDTVGDNIISGFQVGMPIPTCNRNQGAIYQAHQQIQASEQQVLKKTLDLRNRLAMAFQTYRDAKLQVNAFENEILPKAAETLKLVSTGYQQGEVNFLQLLTAQRTYFQTNMTYMDQLQRLLQKHAEISGMLLSDSLR